MKLSKKGEYALRAMVQLARNYPKGVVRIGAISDKEKIPKKFLERILVDLKKAGLVRSTRGLDGGYELCRPPVKITLAEVIREIDGPLAPLSCVSRYNHVCCPDEKRCGLKAAMLKVRNAIAGVLEKLTLKDIAGK